MALGHWPKSPRTAVHHLRPSDLAQVPRDRMSIPQALGTGSESAGTAHPPRGPRTQAQVTGTAGRTHGPEFPGTFGRPQGPLDTSASRGTDVRNPGPRALSRVYWEGWSTLRAFGPGPQSPGRAGRHRGPSNPGLRHRGQGVDPVGPLTLEEVVRDNWSIPRAFGL